MSDLSERILARLAELGDNPDAISEKLLELGITGTIEGDSCPLYYYLHESFPVVEWVSNDRVWIEDNSVKIRLPLPAEQFVDLFDHGHYPKLRSVS